MQDNDERLGTRHPIKPAVMGFPADKVTCRMQTFECSLLRPLEYICLFNFVARSFPQGLISSQVHQGIRLISLYSALRWNVCFLFLRLFLIFWLISFYMLPVAVWATFGQQSFFGQHFLAQHRENWKFVQNLKIWLYFSPNLFSLYGDFTVKNTNSAAESGSFVRKTRGYSVVQNEDILSFL